MNDLPKAKKTTDTAFPSAMPLPDEAAKLAYSAPPFMPREQIKQALAERVHLASAPPTGCRFLAAQAPEGWLTTVFAGVRFKPLSVDVARDVAWVLMELAAGAEYPVYHSASGASAEEALVLSGELIAGGRLHVAGDYFQVPGEVGLGEALSPGGCVVAKLMPATDWAKLRLRMEQSNRPA